MFVRRVTKVYAESYQGHSQEIWLLTIMTFLNRAGSMVLPFLAVYAKTVLDFSLGQTGLMVGSFGAGGLLGSYLGGWLSDKIGSRPIIIMSMLIGGVFYIALQFTVDFYALSSLIFVAGIFTEGYRPAMMALIGDLVDKNAVARTMALVRLAINIGFGLGTAVGGFIAAHLGYDLLFWIDGLTCILAGVFFLIVTRNWHSRPHYVSGKRTTDKTGSIPPHKNGKYLMFCVGTLLMGFTFIQWFHTIPTFIKEDWLFDERYIGIMFTVNTLVIGIFELPIIHHVEVSRAIRKSMIFGLICIGLSFLPFLANASLFWMFAAVLIFTLGEIFYLPLNTSQAIVYADDKRRGEYMSYYSMTWSVVHILGPLLGFAIVEQIDYTGLWIVVSVLSIFSMLFFRSLGVGKET